MVITVTVMYYCEDAVLVDPRPSWSMEVSGSCGCGRREPRTANMDFGFWIL